MESYYSSDRESRYLKIVTDFCYVVAMAVLIIIIIIINIFILSFCYNNHRFRFLN